MPVLIAIGDKDKVAGSAEGLARLIPGAEVFIIPNRDHMLATGDQPLQGGRAGLPEPAALSRICQSAESLAPADLLKRFKHLSHEFVISAGYLTAILGPDGRL